MTRFLPVRIVFPAAVVLLLLAWFLLREIGGSARPDPLTRRGSSIVLVTVEGLRWDYSRFTALPHLESLEHDAISFRSAFTPSPLSLPAHASILTGDYPLRHGLRGAVSDPLPQGAVTLAEVIRSGGYRTGAVVSSPLLDRRFGLDQGFDRFDDSRAARDRRSICTAGSLGSTTRRAIEWIGEARSGPFFVWIQYRLPPFEARRLRERARRGSLPGPAHYASALLMLDEELGRLFRFLRERGLWDPVILILAGAHGEALGERNETGHGVFLSEAAVRVPFLLKLADGQRLAAGDIPSPVSLVDLRPTLLHLIGIPDDRETDGRNLLPLLHGREPEVRFLYLESTYPRDQLGGPVLRGVRDGPYLYLEGWRSELQYHPAGAEGPENPLVWDPERERRMAAELDRIVKRLEAGAPVPEPGAHLDRDFARALRECGYLPERRPSPPAARAPLTASRAAELQGWLSRARGLLGRAAPNRAGRVLREAIALDPGNAGLLHLLGVVRGLQGNLEDSELILRESAAADPGRPELYEDIARLYREREDPAGVIPLLEEAIVRMPESILLHNELAAVWMAAGEEAHAEELFHRVLDLVPADPTALRGLAAIARRRGEFDLAADRLREILKRHPGSSRIRIELGEILLERGARQMEEGSRPAGRDAILQAIGEFRTILLLEPDHTEAKRGLEQAREFLQAPDEPSPS